MTDEFKRGFIRPEHTIFTVEKQIEKISLTSVTNADMVDNFHASQTPTPNTVVVSNSLGKINSGWLSSIPWSSITSTPSSLSGYGITNAYTKSEVDANFSPISHTHTEANLNLSDVTTNNSTTLRHGFLPKLSGNITEFLRGDGAWAVPAGGGGGGYTWGDGLQESSGTVSLSGQALSLHNLASNGIVVRTGNASITSRTITAGSNKVSVTNGDGVSSDPAIDVIEANLNLNNISGVLGVTKGGSGLSSIGSANQLLGVNATGTGLEYKTLQGTANRITVTHSTNSVTLNTPQDIHTGASPTFASMTLTNSVGSPLSVASTTVVTNFNADLLDGQHASAFASVTRNLSAGTGLTGGGDLSADRSFALTGQALAIHNLATNGIVARTAANTFASRTITGTSGRVAVTNGDGISGNPVIDLATSGVSAGTYTKVTVDTYGRVTNGATLTAGDLPSHTHTEADLSLSDVTTNNSTTLRHGFLPKLTGSTTEFLRGDGAWAVPPGGGGGSGLTFDVWHVLNPINANTYHLPNAVNGTALTTIAFTANRIYYIPFVPLRNVSATAIAVEVTTGASGTGTVGIYDSNTNFRPSTLLGSATINTGSVGVTGGTISVSLTGGKLYWLAVISSAAATIRGIAVGGVSPLLGIATGGTAWNTHYFENGTGTLPTTANASSNGTGTVPAIYVRYSNA